MLLPSKPLDLENPEVLDDYVKNVFDVFKKADNAGLEQYISKNIDLLNKSYYYRQIRVPQEGQVKVQPAEAKTIEEPIFETTETEGAQKPQEALEKPIEVKKKKK